MTRTAWALLVLILALTLQPVPAWAQADRPQEDIKPQPKLGASLPMDAVFKDETGKPVRLGDYFGADRGSKPVILHLLYFGCPQVCGSAMNDMVQSLIHMVPAWTVGQKFDILTISFDPKETTDLAAAKKKSVLDAYGRPGSEANWHFLTSDEKNIKALIDAVGFYRQWSATDNQYQHSVELILVGPEGKTTHFLSYARGAYEPTTLRLALTESSGGQQGTLDDKLTLFFCGYDPAAGKYTLIISRIFQVGGLATAVVLGAFILALTLASRRKARQTATTSAIH